MTGKAGASEGDEIDLSVDLSSLPANIAEIIPELDQGQRLQLQAYLEIHNHVGEFPLHITVEALEKLVPGSAAQTISESLKDVQDERKRLNQAQTTEVVQKTVATIFGWLLAGSGAFFGITVLTRPDPTVADLIAGALIMAFCIGGPIGVARMMSNSGVKFGVQTRIEDPD